jgi:hypothetical protein
MVFRNIISGFFIKNYNGTENKINLLIDRLPGFCVNLKN